MLIEFYPIIPIEHCIWDIEFRPFCGFGSVLYHLKEYELALRAFMKAKELRENSIGSENIENAVIYNNMGCCMH